MNNMNTRMGITLYVKRKIIEKDSKQQEQQRQRRKSDIAKIKKKK